LAEFLKTKFQDRGIPTGDIYFEDWGVALPVLSQEFSTLIGCGNNEEEEGGYLCFVSLTPSFFQKLFGKGNAGNNLVEIKSTLDQILREFHQISKIQWHEGKN